jgi:cyclophilin family peptidyl-prolyl cis-trans isomerase
MPLPRLPRALALALLLATAHPAAAVPATDGLYATFTVSQGGAPLDEFTAELHYNEAPLAVGNFVGLAEGTQTWIDPVTYQARTAPFYEGILFHRVIAGFVIQAGSPQGDGSDGPGYTFPDEFDPSLRHDAAGVLSMANSGTNSNGSQFFVTLAATSFLDDVHTVFGTVVEGLDVVQAIGAVATDTDDRPLTDIVIDSVVITRNGAAAQAFDPAAQALPRVERTDAALTRNGTSFDLGYTQEADRQYFTAASTNLEIWAPVEVSAIVRGADAPGPDTLPLDGVFDTTVDPRGFVAHTAVAYPDTVLSPPDAVGKQVVLSVTDGPDLIYVITQPDDAAVSVFGSAQLDTQAPGDIIFYLWRQEAYRVLFVVQSTSIIPIRASLVFNTSGGGTFKATNLNNNLPFSGTFTFGDAP